MVPTVRFELTLARVWAWCLSRLGYVGKTDGVGGSRTLASDRARIAGWPAAQPRDSRLRRSRTSVSRASTGRLRRVSYQSKLKTSAGVEPACAALQAAGWPLSHLARWIGEKESNPHCLVQSEVACRLADPRRNSCTRTSCARAFQEVVP